ncbi:MAG: DoxX family membrane protein [Phycisphaerales bacterium]|nr:DoxX family membrane protein [Phycisphaerales bacterium]
MSGPPTAIRALLLLIRLAIAGVFAFAATLKIADPQAFAFSIHGFKIVPEPLVPAAAFVVPWTEMICAAALVFGLWSRSAALILSAMLAAFIGAIVSALLRSGVDPKCGCFGDFGLLCPPDKIGWCNVGQNALLLAASLALTVWGGGLLSMDALACRRRAREA